VLRGGFVLVHLFILHLFGSVARGGVVAGGFKSRFFPKFLFKDRVVIGGLVLGFLGGLIIDLAEEENFLLADLVSSPLHIKPE